MEPPRVPSGSFLSFLFFLFFPFLSFFLGGGHYIPPVGQGLLIKYVGGCEGEVGWNLHRYHRVLFFLFFSFLFFFGRGALHPPSGPGPPHKMWEVVRGRLAGTSTGTIGFFSFFSFLFFWGGWGALHPPPVGQGLLMHEVSRSHDMINC